jgi:hypothetical protein
LPSSPRRATPPPHREQAPPDIKKAMAFFAKKSLGNIALSRNIFKILFQNFQQRPNTLKTSRKIVG